MREAANDAYDLSHIDVIDTQKLFHDKYLYKVVIPLSAPLARRTTAADVARQMERLGAKIIQPLMGDAKVVMSKASKSYSYFFSDSDKAKRFITENADIVEEVHQPRTTREAAVLLAIPHALIRDELIWGKYSWVMHLKAKTGDDLEIISENLKKHFNHDGMNGRCEIGGRSGDVISAYFEEYVDVIVAQLMLGDCVKKVQQVVLQRDIDVKPLEALAA